MFSILDTKKRVIGAINKSICAVEIDKKFYEFNLHDVKSFDWKPDNKLYLGFINKEIVLKGISSAMANKILLYMRTI